MDWKELYKEKLVSPDEAISNINSQSRIVTAHACAEPKILVDALVKNKNKFENLEIVHMVAMGKAEYVNDNMKKHFTHNALFAGASTRTGQTHENVFV